MVHLSEIELNIVHRLVYRRASYKTIFKEYPSVIKSKYQITNLLAKFDYLDKLARAEIIDYDYENKILHSKKYKSNDSFYDNYILEADPSVGRCNKFKKMSNVQEPKLIISTNWNHVVCSSKTVY